jgi:hypothetical protein
MLNKILLLKGTPNTSKKKTKQETVLIVSCTNCDKAAQVKTESNRTGLESNQTGSKPGIEVQAPHSMNHHHNPSIQPFFSSLEPRDKHVKPVQAQE